MAAILTNFIGGTVSGKLTTVGLNGKVDSTVKGRFVGNPLQGVERDTAQAVGAQVWPGKSTSGKDT